MDDLGLDEVIATRRQGHTVSDDRAEAILRSVIDNFGPTDDHWVRWSGTTWTAADTWGDRTHAALGALVESLGDDGHAERWMPIARRDVFARAEHGHLDLFVAAMAWGFGVRGYGWRRTSDIIAAAGENRVADAVERLKTAAIQGGPSGVWQAWSRGGDAKLRGLDTAFASKVAYFASYDREQGSGPLIADLNTTWALWALGDIWDSRTSAQQYEKYVHWAQHRAEKLGCRSDDVERALFVIGPDIRKAWTRPAG